MGIIPHPRFFALLSWRSSWDNKYIFIDLFYEIIEIIYRNSSLNHIFLHYLLSTYYYLILFYKIGCTSFINYIIICLFSQINFTNVDCRSFSQDFSILPFAWYIRFYNIFPFIILHFQSMKYQYWAVSHHSSQPTCVVSAIRFWHFLYPLIGWSFHSLIISDCLLDSLFQIFINFNRKFEIWLILWENYQKLFIFYFNNFPIFNNNIKYKYKINTKNISLNQPKYI